MGERDAIPAEVKRRILVEAGHRCAIPTCRHIEVEIHHIIPWSQCQTHEYANLIALCPNCHRRADHGEIDRKSLRIYKANLRFAHDKFSNLEIDLIFELQKLEPGKTHQWPTFNLLLINRAIDAGYIKVQKQNVSVQISGMETAPVLISLTSKGREFWESLNLEPKDN